MIGGASVRGADQLVRSLDAAAAELQQLAEADDAAGRLLATDVAQAAPHRTGFLASTVEHTGSRVTIGAKYAVYVHAANPWAARVADADAAHVAEIYEQAVIRAVQRVKGA